MAKGGVGELSNETMGGLRAHTVSAQCTVYSLTAIEVTDARSVCPQSQYETCLVYIAVRLVLIHQELLVGGSSGSQKEVS